MSIKNKQFVYEMRNFVLQNLNLPVYSSIAKEEEKICFRGNRKENKHRHIINFNEMTAKVNVAFPKLPIKFIKPQHIRTLKDEILNLQDCVGLISQEGGGGIGFFIAFYFRLFILERCNEHVFTISFVPYSLPLYVR